ncbi:unnamed protein product [Oikopleura dioica]|uniref:Proteasome subunit beta n=1 Tax=Oikopleura dioica TaxID=34765 RepID=E4XBG4_OIKDI|nr:unnamed protein product [Oikopleura dioica]CBY33769.1 unnamed protein product [Oikopleura dioica]
MLASAYSVSNGMEPSTRTLSPSVTGGSILGIMFEGGVLLAGDRLGAYGGLHRFRDIDRIIKVNDNVLITYTGDVADFQYIEEILEDEQRENDMRNDGYELGPSEYFNLMGRIMYNRRSKGNPLWNRIIVAGYDKAADKPFMGQIDSKGTVFESHLIGTGFGGFLVHPLMERELEKIDGRPTKEQATQILERALKVLYYRDKTTYNKWSIGTTEKSGSSIEASRELATNWQIAKLIVGYE